MIGIITKPCPMTNSILFSRYYDSDGILITKTMDEMDDLIKDESKRKEIATLVYHRLYDRFLKIFFYPATQEKVYSNSEGKEVNIFDKEYKHGFLIMASCCLLIETLCGYIKGKQTLGKGGDGHFNVVFKKCQEYNNPLIEFHNKKIYRDIRNVFYIKGKPMVDLG